MHLYLLRLSVRMIFRIFGSAILLLLIGCSNGVPSNSTTKTSLTPTPTSNTPQALFAQNPSNQIKVGGMLTIAPNGGAVGCSHTVFATNRLTYSSNEIRQMTNYIESFFTSNTPLPTPDTFANAQGGFATNIPNWGMNFIPGCTGDWEVTNISQGPVQIAQVNTQLTADPQPDTYQYRFIDICSLPYTPLQEQPCLRGGGVIKLNYTITVGPASASTVFQSQVVSAALTIPPGQTIEVLFNVIPANPNSSFFYTLTPELVLNSAAGNDQVFNLTQLTSTIALVNINQFACYQFHGNTLTPIAPIFTGPESVTPGASSVITYPNLALE